MTEIKKKLPRISVGIFLLTAISVLLYTAFLLSEEFADWFNRGIGNTVRHCLSFLTSWIPFSLAEFLIVTLPLTVAIVILIAVRHYCDSARDALVYLGILLSVVCLLFDLFIWSFASGYRGKELDRKLNISRENITAAELLATADRVAEEMAKTEPELISLSNGETVMPYSFFEMNEKLNIAYERFAEKYEILDTFRSSPKQVVFSSAMSQLHITGLYSCFTGEANINVDFPDYTIPYTAAHEMAHQRGISREDEANFVAFLVCMESDDAYIRYSALLNMHEYLGNALYEEDPTYYYTAFSKLPEIAVKEEVAYYDFYQQYRDSKAAKVNETINDTYLKSQGEAEGTKSYDLVVELAVAYYREQP